MKVQDGFTERTWTGLGVLTMFITSWVNSALSVVNRCLQGTDVGVIMYYHSILGFTVPLACVLTHAFLTNRPLFHTTNLGYLWVTIGSITDVLSVGTNIIAFQCDSSGFLSLISYSSVAYAFMFDVFVFDVIMTPF